MFPSMKIAAWVLKNFGSIMVFQAAYRFIGLKPAIALSLIFILGELIWLKIKKQPFTPFMIFSFALTGLFGFIDLASENATFFKYESAIINLIFAGYFGISLLQNKSILEELAEQQGRISKDTSEDKTFFFRFMTSIWLVYFLGKAISYAWVASTYSIEQATYMKWIFGTLSFYILLGISLGLSRQIWIALLKLKWMPSTRGE